MPEFLRFSNFSAWLYLGFFLCFFYCLFPHLFIQKRLTHITGDKNEVMMAVHTGNRLTTSKWGRSGDCSDDSFRSVCADNTEAITRGISSRDPRNNPFSQGEGRSEGCISPHSTFCCHVGMQYHLSLYISCQAQYKHRTASAEGRASDRYPCLSNRRFDCPSGPRQPMCLLFPQVHDTGWMCF